MRLRWRIALTLVVTVFAVVYTLPSIPQVRESPVGQFLPKEQVSLGLDLRGGIYLTLGVGVDEAIDNHLMQTIQTLRSRAEEQGIYLSPPKRVASNRVEFVLTEGARKNEVDILLNDLADFVTESSAPMGENNERVRYTISYNAATVKRVSLETLDQVKLTIQNRIDQFGLTEPEIRVQPQDNRIQVQLPGMSDPARALEIISQTAHLEFHIVRQDGNEAEGIWLPDAGRTAADGARVLVDRNVALTGEYIKDARVSYGQDNQPLVALTFTPQGGAALLRVTGDNVGRQLAIVLDGKVYSAPVIREPVGADNRCTITGRFTPEEAADLALVLRSGSLPAKVSVLEERSVGPSLGNESIHKGILSCLVGGALVVLFMIVYYGFSGLIADSVLILNVLLITAGLACFGATLTLPGIAGIILTIGMAVDANVLINERIREELRRGLTVRAAIEEGYSRATLTIIDSHVTTIMASIVLYQFGTGPVRGFAVTLGLGILASLFTAVFVSHILFDIWTSLKQRHSLSV